MSNEAEAPAIQRRGLMLVLSSPSGAGKTTLSRQLLDNDSQIQLSVSCTTRARRPSEKDGVDYRFVDVMTFKQKIEAGEFVEWAEVHGSFYGSPQAVIDHALATKGVAVFDIDVQGGQAIKRKHPEAALVFVLPPSMEELERRLRGRKTDSEDTIQKRLLGARSEIERGVASYDYVIINDDLERAYTDLRSVLAAERCRRGRVDLVKLKLGEAAGPSRS